MVSATPPTTLLYKHGRHLGIQDGTGETIRSTQRKQKRLHPLLLSTSDLLIPFAMPVSFLRLMVKFLRRNLRSTTRFTALRVNNMSIVIIDDLMGSGPLGLGFCNIRSGWELLLQETLGNDGFAHSVDHVSATSNNRRYLFTHFLSNVVTRQARTLRLPPLIRGTTLALIPSYAKFLLTALV